MGLLVAGRQVAVGMDSGGGGQHVWGLDFLDGVPAHHANNPTRNPGSRLPVGKTCDVTIQVRNNHITASCGGETLIDWTGAPERLSLWNGVKLPRSDALFFWAQADFVIHKMTLIPRGAAASQDRSFHWPADAPPPAIAPFDAEQAKAHQEAWAKYLGVPVEYTNSIGMKFRLVPPGTNAVGQTGIGESDGPLYAGTTEVTVAQFRRFVKETQHQTAGEAGRLGGMRVRAGAKTERNPAYIWSSPEFAQGDDHPVTLVTWHDVRAFCEWLTRTEGRSYRLPTSAEWRWLERAGSPERPAVGGSNVDEHAWHRGNSEMHAHSVAAKQANPWGLFDLYGNVWELAYDWRRGSESVNPFLNKTGPDVNDRVLFQGGAFSAEVKDGPEPATGPPQIGYSHLGFRVVAEIPDVRRIEVRELPATSAPSPTVHRYASGEWIDVIPLIDPDLDKWDMRLTGRNEWRIEQGELVAVADEKPRKLLLPLDSDFWPSFECELEFTRRAGEQGFNLNFSAGTGDTPLRFGHPNSPGVDLFMRQKGPVSLAETPQIETGRRTTLRIEVRPTADAVRITVWNDDVQVGAWTGDRNQLVSINNEGYPHGRRLSLWIGGEGTEYVFHRIRVRTLDGGTATAVRPGPADPAISPPTDATARQSLDPSIPPSAAHPANVP
jgi:formylglycine-generating enzyme required for sulfatase activity